jgi:hypothetical protein
VSADETRGDIVTRLVAVQGTTETQRPGGWWREDSAFWQHLEPHGIVPAKVDGQLYEWDSRLSTSMAFLLRWFGRPVRGWVQAGKSLCEFLGRLPYEDRNVVAYSHGAQPVFFACVQGARIRRLLTVGSPVRADMVDARLATRIACGKWWHICDHDRDWTAIWGMFGDGRIGGDSYVPSDPLLLNWRRMPEAHANLTVKEISHGLILTDQTMYWRWEQQRLVNFIRGEGYAHAA